MVVWLPSGYPCPLVHSVRIASGSSPALPNIPERLSPKQCAKLRGGTLGFTQTLTEMSNKIRKILFLGIRARPVGTADDLAAICEPIV
jgi:hypothetical protein